MIEAHQLWGSQSSASPRRLPVSGMVLNVYAAEFDPTSTRLPWMGEYTGWGVDGRLARKNNSPEHSVADARPGPQGSLLNIDPQVSHSSILLSFLPITFTAGLSCLPVQENLCMDPLISFSCSAFHYAGLLSASAKSHELHHIPGLKGSQNFYSCWSADSPWQYLDSQQSDRYSGILCCVGAFWDGQVVQIIAADHL